MELYHVSFRSEGGQKHFYPRIPESAGDGENKDVARICLSSSVEGCIQAIGPTGRSLQRDAVFCLYKADIDESSEELITPEALFQSGLVPDCLENREYWYLSDLIMEGNKCKILDFEGYYDIAWSCVKNEDVKDIIEKMTGKESIQFRDRIATAIAAEQRADAMYYKALRIAEEFNAFTLLDTLWDEIAGLPWAQAYKVRKLSFESLTRQMGCF